MKPIYFAVIFSFFICLVTEIQGIQCPVCAHIGEKDGHIPPDEVDFFDDSCINGMQPNSKFLQECDPTPNATCARVFIKQIPEKDNFDVELTIRGCLYVNSTVIKAGCNPYTSKDLREIQDLPKKVLEILEDQRDDLPIEICSCNKDTCIFAGDEQSPGSSGSKLKTIFGYEFIVLILSVLTLKFFH